MAQLHLTVSMKRRWWAMPMLRALWCVYWVAGRFMTQRQADAFADRCISFIADHGVKASVAPK
ncbi:hypothetical protein [Shinella sp.]|uniref:hypothetical protein n=1 Tax=Shinella sp. TaxID=1870904 RepID=UPI00289CEB0A|nr:hypothetical protein [Shinella sp.]